MTLSEKQYLEKLDKRAGVIRKFIRHLRDEIREDFGDECKEWNEECVICQVYKALRVLDNVYLDEKNK